MFIRTACAQLRLVQNFYPLAAHQRSTASVLRRLSPPYECRRWSMAGSDLAPAVVSVQWLQQRMEASGVTEKGDRNLRVLDCTWHKPTAGRNAVAEYHQSHIQGAKYFDIDECSDKESPYSHMLPTPSVFDQYVGSLGVKNNCHVVVYDNNDSVGLFSSPRVWWMFRVFGHDRVSVLDGGLPRWKALGLPTTSEPSEVHSEIFRSNPRFQLVQTYDDVLRNLTSKAFYLIDTRSVDTYQKSDDSPHWSGNVAGHIPGAHNLPYGALLDPATKLLKGRAEMEKVFREYDVNLETPIVSSCGSGVTACMVVLAAHICGVHDIPVYDGSWTEWSRRAKPEHIVTERNPNTPDHGGDVSDREPVKTGPRK